MTDRATETKLEMCDPVVIEGGQGPGHETADPPPQRHRVYYLNNTPVSALLLVGGMVYKVQRYILERESTRFYEIFKISPNEDDPIALDDVTCGELEVLLDLIYDCNFTLQTCPIDQLNLLLAISARYSIDKVRAGEMSLAEKFNMGSMREEAWGKLVSRDDCLQIEEAEKLGISQTVQLVQEREGTRKEGFKTLQEDLRQEIKQLGDELALERKRCKTLEQRTAYGKKGKW
ncbi:hypothetical protein OF83DRAFT_1283482 [Amylostereum chailletii]|nr:hypothetical protein OF83DRAFT_1283482 [Amylostereum chailletii]